MGLVLAFASLIAAVVPMFTYMVIIWWLDRNEREPFWMVLLCFVWGGTGAIILAIIGSILFQIPLATLIVTVSNDPADLIDLSGAVVVAPIVEEATKGVFLLIIAMSKRFDGIVDGVVYGGAIGLGFGMTENFMYFLSYGTTPASWLFIVVIRTLFSAVMHCMSTATLGAFIGYAKFKGIGWKMLLVPMGYAVAVFLHFAWNASVSFEDTTLLGFLFLIMYFVAIFAIFQIAIYMEGKTIHRELEDESINGVIPSEHLLHLPFVTKRNKKGWLHTSINQKEYVKTSIVLALRKSQYKSTTGNRQTVYLKEVESYRYKIQMMFYNAGLPVKNAKDPNLQSQ